MTTPTVEDVLQASIKALMVRWKFAEKRAQERYEEDMKACKELRRKADVLKQLDEELTQEKPLSQGSKEALLRILFGDYGWINTDSFQESKGG